jgi:hypothetical protein
MLRQVWLELSISLAINKKTMKESIPMMKISKKAKLYLMTVDLIGKTRELKIISSKAKNYP